MEKKIVFTRLERYSHTGMVTVYYNDQSKVFKDITAVLDDVDYSLLETLKKEEVVLTQEPTKEGDLGMEIDYIVLNNHLIQRENHNNGACYYIYCGEIDDVVHKTPVRPIIDEECYDGGSLGVGLIVTTVIFTIGGIISYFWS